MSKVVLHIGTHKTATTTIQDTFWHNASRLLAAGVVYPCYGRITGHHGLVFDWATLPDVYRLPGGSRAALRALSKAHGDSDRTVFLSSEEFSRASPKAQTDFAEVRDLLSGFDRIEVVVTLRIQWQFLQSIYLEVSKKRGIARPPILVGQCINRGEFAGLWTDYGKLYDHLRQWFEPSEIHLVDYEVARRRPGGILGYYLDHLGTGLVPADLKPVNGGTSNVSADPLASWAANLIAEPEVAPVSLVERSAAQLKALYGENMRSCLFSKPEFERLDAWSGESNAALAERVAAVQPGFRLENPDRSAITHYRDSVSGDFWIAYCRSLYSGGGGKK
jgi:hypothetical protein